MALPPRGGLPSSGEIAPSVLRELFAYVTCPACRRLIRLPFSRSSGPVPYVHRDRNTECRLVVHPDPVGENHNVLIVPDGVSIEIHCARYMLELRKAA